VSTFTVIDLDAAACVAASVSVSRGRVRLRHSCQAELPTNAPPDEIGAAIREAMREAGFRAGPTLVSIPRGDVSVKVLDIPGAADLDPAELGEIVRLQMIRQLSAHAERVVVDHLPPRSADAAPAGVVAAAIAEPTLERIRAIVRAAGGRTLGVRLRSSGARAAAHDGPALGTDDPNDERADDPAADGAETPFDSVTVAWQPRGAEIVVGRAGRLVFVRGVDIPRPAPGDDPEPAARRLAVEVSRTVVSYRVAPAGGSIERVAVLGDDPAARAAAGAIARATDLPVNTRSGLDAFAGLADLDPHAVGPLLPLLGLADLHARRERCLDFHNPVRPPDRSAGARQLALAGAFALIVLAGAGYLFAGSRLRPLDRRIEQLQTESRELQTRYVQLLLEQARVGHADAWLNARADLAAHLRAAVDQLPSPPDAVLDDIALNARAAVGFTPGENLASPDAYAGAVAVDARVSGSVASRAVAADLRARLLALDLYDTVTSRGPEVAGRFDLELRSLLANPSDSAEDASPNPAEAQQEASP